MNDRDTEKADDLLDMVIAPYTRKLKSERLLPRQPLDIFTVYRVVYQPNDESDITTDVFLPTSQVSGEGPNKTLKHKNVAQLFSVGMELELERYLRWLDIEALTDKNGISPTIFVGRQSAGDAIEAVTRLAPRDAASIGTIVQHHTDDSELYKHCPWLSIPKNYSVRRKDWILF